jgi:Adenine specific DNA methylase Mod
MDKLKMHTPNQADENFRKLAALFPNAVTETIDEATGEIVRAIDKDVLMQEISTRVVEGREERYQFSWPDKKKAMLAANAPIAATLRPVRAESVSRDGTPGGWDSQNLYIEGDNLDVLKLLQETYLGKVKMIYIDPPYNTGNDFVYEDDFAENTEEYLARSGQFDEQGNRLEQNTESNGRFHTDWLNMLYPRLRLAKNLLSDDGIIFISMGEEEIENLYSLCNEVFGKAQHLGTFIWKRRQMVDSRSKNGVSEDHEYMLCYSKSAMQHIRGAIADMSKYSNPDNDPRGDWMSADMTGLATASQRPNLHYTIMNPETGIEYACPPLGWRYDRKHMMELIENNEVIWPSNPEGRPRRKKFVKDLQSTFTGFSTILSTVFNTQGTRELKTLFEGEDYFDFPKPVDLIKLMLEQGSEKDSIVLDFFSGSATTAHALIQLNAEDSGHRRFIMVQLPEQTDQQSEAYKAGYKTICDIGKERIRRAGRKIKETAGLTVPDLDIGFRVLRLDSSNMQDVYYNPTEVVQSLLDLTTDNIKPDRTPEDLLFQVMLDLGVELSSAIKETVIDGKKVFDVADGFLLACFDTGVTTETVTAIAKKKPYYAIFRDSSMANDSVATNFDQIFETYSPQTTRKVL